MWTTQSNPHKEPIGVSKPIIADKPVTGHPPPFVKVNRASEAVARGERIHNGTIMAKRPIMWTIRTIPSKAGSLFTKTVLNRTQNPVIAQTRRVPCHRSKTYVGLFKTIRPCMMVPTRKPTDKSPACQPIMQIHPGSIHQTLVHVSKRGDTVPTE